MNYVYCAIEQYIGQHSAGKTQAVTNDLHLAWAAWAYAQNYPIRTDPRHETIIQQAPPSAIDRKDKPGFTRLHVYKVFDPARVLRVGQQLRPDWEAIWSSPRFSKTPTIPKAALIQALGVHYGLTLEEIRGVLSGASVSIIRNALRAAEPTAASVYLTPWTSRSQYERDLALTAAKAAIEAAIEAQS